MTKEKNSSDDESLKGKGESSTIRFVVYIFFQIICVNKVLYGLIWTLLVISGVALYNLLRADCGQAIQYIKPLIELAYQIGVFTAPFIFVSVAVFPSFSDKFRERLERPSRRTGRPLAQSMLDHFIFVLLGALGMLLIGAIGKYLLEVKFFQCPQPPVIMIVVFAVLYVLSAMLLISTLIELVHSVRTIYILILADYSKKPPSKLD